MHIAVCELIINLYGRRPIESKEVNGNKLGSNSAIDRTASNAEIVGDDLNETLAMDTLARLHT